MLTLVISLQSRFNLASISISDQSRANLASVITRVLLTSPPSPSMISMDLPQQGMGRAHRTIAPSPSSSLMPATPVTEPIEASPRVMLEPVCRSRARPATPTRCYGLACAQPPIHSHVGPSGRPYALVYSTACRLRSHLATQATTSSCRQELRLQWPV